MNFDLDVRSKRLEKEHLKLREDARKKKEKDLISRANLMRLDEELRELNQKRKLEAEELESERERLEDEENQLTGGVKYNETLKSVAVDGEDDKVILPESALQILSSQDAFGKGAAVFQLSVTNTDGSVRVTHCGVREFSAAAGTIGLPPKVLSSLWADNSMQGFATIKYVRLGKISYVKLQPTFNTFFKVEQVKMVLEDNLKFHSTLTLGDIITVWYRGIAHPLKVIEMKPSDKGVLLDTDVEVDLDNSLENKRITDEEAAAEEAQSKVESDIGHKLGGHQLSSSSSIYSGSEFSPSPVGASAPVQSASETSTVTLPSEPEQDAEDIVSIRVRTPGGNTINRRFYRKQPFIHLFEFASVEMKVEKRVLQLSTRFPNRVFTLNDIEPSDVSFFEAGITASQEMFLASLLI